MTLNRFRSVTRFLPAHQRERLFHRLPRRLRDSAWRDLAKRSAVKK